MERQDEKAASPGAAVSELWRWSTTPPQSYLVYVICLCLVLGASYYAGTLNPKKKPGLPPPATLVPRN